MNHREWVEWYEARTGGEMQCDDDELVMFHKDHGFVTLMADEENKCLECHHMAGDGKFWQPLIMEGMKKMGYDKLRFFTRRNPEAWIRRYGGHIRGYYMEVSLDEAKV